MRVSTDVRPIVVKGTIEEMDALLTFEEARATDAHLRAVALAAKLERADAVIEQARLVCRLHPGPDTLALREALARYA